MTYERSSFQLYIYYLCYLVLKYHVIYNTHYFFFPISQSMIYVSHCFSRGIILPTYSLVNEIHYFMLSTWSISSISHHALPSERHRIVFFYSLTFTGKCEVISQIIKLTCFSSRFEFTGKSQLKCYLSQKATDYIKTETYFLKNCMNVCKNYSR
jgi:hypothetical protein